MDPIAPLPRLSPTSANIICAVRQSGTPQWRLAAALSLSPGAFSDRMRGRTPWRLADLDALAAYWRLAPADIIGREDPTALCLCGYSDVHYDGTAHAGGGRCQRPVTTTSPRAYGTGAVCEECAANHHKHTTVPRLRGVR